ncbi:MAG: MFS transporter [Desulfobulbaceae bacterium]|nr:MFS transporter [Desulfobulbaceae bacterium]
MPKVPQALPQKTFMPAGHPRSYMRLLRQNRNYRQFWFSGVVSQLGDWFNYIAIFVLLTELTGSGRAVSWYLIAKFIPTAILGPACGILVDRLNRKSIMVSCDLLRFVVVLGYLFVVDAGQVWLVYVLALTQESIWTFSHLARQATVPTICKPEEINVANGLAGTSWSVMLAAGAAMGGFVTSLFGWRIAICIDSATFLVSALLISRVVIDYEIVRRKVSLTWKRISGLEDFLEGVKYLDKHRNLIPLIFIKSGWALAGGGILVMLTVFGEQVFTGGGSGGQSGILYSMRGLGAAIGPIVAWRLFGDEQKGMQWAIGLGFIVSAFSYLLFAMAPTIALASIFVLCAHCGGSVQWVFSTSLLHRTIDSRFRGRVFAAEMALMTLFISVSTWSTGQALDLGYAPRDIVTVLSVLFFLPGLLWLSHLFLIRNR